MTEAITIIVGAIGTLAGVILSVLYARRARRAEVLTKEAEASSREIETADQMIDLVKKANAEVLQLNKSENERLRKSITRLEKALRLVSDCDYRAECPITAQLRSEQADSSEHGQAADYNR